MKAAVRALLAFVLTSAAIFGDEPVVLFRPLDKPLQLPPGGVQKVPLVSNGSFFGEAIRAVDCANDDEAVYGICGNQLFGGLVMGISHLSGGLQIQFSQPVNNVTHFQITAGILAGDDSMLAAPLGYKLPLLNARVTDAPGELSEGDLDLTTGGVTNLKLHFKFADTALDTMAAVNPNIVLPTAAFPGQRGNVWARFEQRADGLLDFTMTAHTFLPLGKALGGDPIRFPLAFCGNSGVDCASVLSRGTAFHPSIQFSTKEQADVPCGTACPEIPENTLRVFTVSAYHTSFGDDFDMVIPQLGGAGEGRAHLQGRMQVQFGPRNGDTVPFAVTSLVPEGLLAIPPASILGNGPMPGLIAPNEQLVFPLQTYDLSKIVFVDEPYNLPQGVIDLKTGTVIGDFVYPSFYGQTLAEALFTQNAPRISTDPFFLVAEKPANGQPGGYAQFQRGANGEMLFRYKGEHRRSFATYIFPSPDFVAGRGYLAGEGSNLDLFLRIQASSTPEPANVVKSGNLTGVRSSVGDTFSYQYSFSCDPAGKAFSFQYANTNSGRAGGTFNMTKLASLSCTNTMNSTRPKGDYDVVTFSGFGTWSKDPAGALPRFVTGQVSTAPDAPYVGIVVFQLPDAKGDVVLSSANTRPASKTLP